MDWGATARRGGEGVALQGGKNGSGGGVGTGKETRHGKGMGGEDGCRRWGWEGGNGMKGKVDRGGGGGR